MLKIAILFTILTVTATAASPWTKADTAREIAYNVVLFVDWKQTREFTQDKYRGIYFENNPLVGGHNPSRSRVNQACILSSVGHYAISRMLPEKGRHIWQYVTLGLESAAVGKNYHIGIRTQF